MEFITECLKEYSVRSNLRKTARNLDYSPPEKKWHGEMDDSR